MTYSRSGINWTWYLEATVVPTSSVTIISKLYRLHNKRNVHPHKLGGYFELIEDNERIVTHVRINDVQYRVTNPEPFWSYPGKES